MNLYIMTWVVLFVIMAWVVLFVATFIIRHFSLFQSDREFFDIISVMSAGFAVFVIFTILKKLKKLNLKNVPRKNFSRMKRILVEWRHVGLMIVLIILEQQFQQDFPVNSTCSSATFSNILVLFNFISSFMWRINVSLLSLMSFAMNFIFWQINHLTLILCFF